MNTYIYNIKNQIHAINTAEKSCHIIKKYLSQDTCEHIAMNKVDFLVQKLVITLHAIDEVHKAYNIPYFSVSTLYDTYLKSLETLTKTYISLTTLLRKKQEALASRLYWHKTLKKKCFGY